MKKPILTVLILIVTFQSQATELTESIRQYFKNKPAGFSYVIDHEVLFYSRELQNFYTNRMFAPAWINQETPVWVHQPTPVWNNWINISKNGNDMLDYIHLVNRHGLQPLDYHLVLIEKFIEKIVSFSPIETEELMKLDLLLTDAYMLLSSHLFYGKVDPEKEGASWKVERKEPEISLGWKLEEALATNNMANGLDQLAPQYPSYWLMKKELAFFLELNKQLWPVMYSILPIKPAESNPIIPQIRERLIKLRYPLADSISASYDKELETQIKSFQENWGLNADGVIGKGTLDVLNSIPDKLMDKLKVNMERFRWLPFSVPEKYIIVNIANFRLDLIEGDDTLLSVRAIVGKQYRETPVFNDQMTYIVFSPSWTVPPTILENDVIPELLKGSEYITKKKMNLITNDGSSVVYDDVDWSKITKDNFPYMVRQVPGSENALGKVKFMFPNTYDVYIHDTPSKGYFARDDRALSSGCIRIEKPLELAVLLMSDMPEWTPAQIKKAMQSNKEQNVTLKTPIDVVLIYLTAWTDGKGQVQFRKDIYKQDEMVLRALNRRTGFDRN